MANARRERLTKALRVALENAPEAERLELDLALEDYRTAYRRSVDPRRIAPLLRDLLDTIEEGANLGECRYLVEEEIGNG